VKLSAELDLPEEPVMCSLMGIWDAMNGKALDKDHPGDLVRAMLDQGFNGWLKLRFVGKDEYWGPGIITQYDNEQYAFSQRGSGALSDITGQFRHIAGFQLIVDPEQKPLPKTTDNRFW
jgi:hypothetical protein